MSPRSLAVSYRGPSSGKLWRAKGVVSYHLPLFSPASGLGSHTSTTPPPALLCLVERVAMRRSTVAPAVGARQGHLPHWVRMRRGDAQRATIGSAVVRRGAVTPAVWVLQGGARWGGKRSTRRWKTTNCRIRARVDTRGVKGWRVRFECPLNLRAWVGTLLDLCFRSVASNAPRLLHA